MESKDLKKYSGLSVDELIVKLNTEELEKKNKENKLIVDRLDFNKSILEQCYWKVDFTPNSKAYVKVLDVNLKCLSYNIYIDGSDIKFIKEKRVLNILWFNVKHLYPQQTSSNICTPITKETFEYYENLEKEIIFH